MGTLVAGRQRPPAPVRRAIERQQLHPLRERFGVAAPRVPARRGERLRGKAAIKTEGRRRSACAWRHGVRGRASQPTSTGPALPAASPKLVRLATICRQPPHGRCGPCRRRGARRAARRTPRRGSPGPKGNDVHHNRPRPRHETRGGAGRHPRRLKITCHGYLATTAWKKSPPLRRPRPLHMVTCSAPATAWCLILSHAWQYINARVGVETTTTGGSHAAMIFYILGEWVGDSVDLASDIEKKEKTQDKQVDTGGVRRRRAPASRSRVRRRNKDREEDARRRQRR